MNSKEEIAKQVSKKDNKGTLLNKKRNYPNKKYGKKSRRKMTKKEKINQKNKNKKDGKKISLYLNNIQIIRILKKNYSLMKLLLFQVFK